MKKHKMTDISKILDQNVPDKGRYTRKWLETYSGREKFSPPNFTDVFFGENALKYLWFRLRFYALNQSFIFLLHLSEFFLLSRVLIGENFMSYILMTHITTLVPSAFWGLLEGQRSELNQSISKSRKNKIIRDWYHFSWLCFVVIAVIYSGIFFLGESNLKNFEAKIFLLLGVVNLFELIPRSRYSAIFAQARVYRPQGSILLLEALCFALNLALYLYFRSPKALLIGLLLSKIFIVSVSWFYTSRAYHVHRLAIPNISSVRFKIPKLPSGINQTKAWNHMFYMLMQRACSVFIILILYQSREGALPLVFHLISPLITASTNWIQIFYFDFRKFRFSAFQVALERYNQPLLILSFGIGLSLALVAIATLKTLMSWQIQILYVPILIFMCFRSLANTRFFLKFDQIAFAFSSAYFVITVVIPSVVIYFGDYDDRAILFLMGVAHVFALAISFCDPQRILINRSNFNTITRSAERYDELRFKNLSIYSEFIGRIDKAFTSSSKFSEKLVAFKDVRIGFVDQSGSFFVLTNATNLVPEFARLSFGEFEFFRKARPKEWLDFFSRCSQNVASEKSNYFEVDIFSRTRNFVIKDGKFKELPAKVPEPQQNLHRLASQFMEVQVDPGEVFRAVKRSLASGRRVRLNSVCRGSIYVRGSVDTDGILNGVKIEMTPD